MGRCFASTPSMPPSSSGNRLHTRPLPASMYLSKESPSSLPKRGMRLSVRNLVTAALSPQPSTSSTGLSPLCVITTFGAPATLWWYHAAFLRLAFAASSKPCSRDSACSTTRGLSPGGGAGSEVLTAAPVIDTTQSTMVSEVRPPSYSASLPSSNHTMVGKPLTLYFEARSFSSVASTFANRTPLDFSSPAAFSYSGVSFLQCPHHGA
mmetsp:Transcript_12433/g.35231  ORF Transcript_12433/g.35231 Transcript_12433/m.35231 type:complete len:208 (-) Transcript_12433:223-846(-)